MWDNTLLYLAEDSNHLFADIDKGVRRNLEILEKQKFLSRLWSQDLSLWEDKDDAISDNPSKLGWLTIAGQMLEQFHELKKFTRRVNDQKFTSVVLIDVNAYPFCYDPYMANVKRRRGKPEFSILDTSDPHALDQTNNRIDLKKTLFLVSSTSGLTQEVINLYEYYWQELYKINPQKAGDNFVAITRPNSFLHNIARTRNFLSIFTYPETVWGHVRAITYPGILPAELVGISTRSFLTQYNLMSKACMTNDVYNNAPVYLGSLLSELYRMGADKLTFLFSTPLRSFGSWFEGSFSENLGKQGIGLIPIINDPISKSARENPTEYYQRDRAFVFFRLDNDDYLDEVLKSLAAAKFPILVVNISKRSDMGREFLRWTFSLLVAAYLLGVHPYTDPDLTSYIPIMKRELSYKVTESFIEVEKKRDSDLSQFFTQIRNQEFLAIQAFIPRDSESEKQLIELQRKLSIHLKMPVILSYGASCLHSIGQLNKGGRNSGAFVQIISRFEKDFVVPGKTLSFGSLKYLQANSYYKNLQEYGRKVMRLYITHDVSSDLRSLLLETQAIMSKNAIDG
jgi:transaldolase/glucose-6-phosphate isomerase